MSHVLSIEQSRARRGENIALMTIGWALLSTLFFAIRAWQWGIEIRIATLGCNLVLGLLAIQMIRRDGRTSISSAIAMLGLAIAITGAVLTSGGTTSISTLWLLMLPVLGGLIGDRQGTAIGIGCSISAYGLMFCGEYMWGALPNLTPPELQANQAYMHQFATLFIVSICVYTFLHQVRNSDNELDTHIVELEKEIAARTEAELAAVQANKSKSEFLANISHEIRTPLNGIIGVLQILEKDANLAEKQQHLVDLGMTSSTTLLALINDLLDIAKIESGKFAIEEEAFDLHGLVTSLHERARQLTLDKPVEVSMDCKLDCDWVKGDVLRLEQVLLNLISNAVKFTPRGHIRLAFRYDQHSQILHASITDTGIGISETALSQVFDAFTQAESTTTRQYGGTGLGLAICNQLLHLMRSELKVESELDQGSRFEFSIPLRPAISGIIVDQTPHLDTPGSLPGGSKVLLVEDNPINAELSLAMLEDLSLEVELATNGAEALELATSNRYQIILMDCQMPVMDGYEATSRIRQQDSLKNLPIIALTANAMNGDREKCLAAGMNDYLTKPIDPEALEEKLAHWLSASQTPT